MSTVFADTFHFLALLNPRDEHHARAQELSESGDFLLTTRAVLLEVADAFSDPAARGLAASFLDSIEHDPTVEIVSLTDELYRRALALYRDRLDKRWSLTDCVSFVVMEERGVRSALTGDRDFMQAGFTALFTSYEG